MSIFEKKSRKKKKKSSPFKKSENSSSVQVKPSDDSQKGESSSKEDSAPNKVVRRIVSDELVLSEAEAQENATSDVFASSNQEAITKQPLSESGELPSKEASSTHEAKTETASASDQSTQNLSQDASDNLSVSNVEEDEEKTEFRRREAPVPETSAEEAVDKKESTSKVTAVESQSEEENKQSASEETKTSDNQPEQKSDNRFSKLGKAVIALPDNYNPNVPKNTVDRTADKTKERSDQRTSDRRKEGKSDRDKRDRNDKTARRAGSRRKIIEQHIERDDMPNLSSRRRRKGRKTIKKTSPKARAIKRRVFVDQSISVANLAHGLSI